VSDAASVLAELDAFGYPLQRRHYGASEMALVEALVCGVVPVVLDNGCESEIVRDGRTGIVAAGEREYTRALEFLYRHPAVRQDMSQAARADARDRFHLHHTVTGWHAIYDELLDRPRAQRSLSHDAEERGGLTRPAIWFLRALGDSPESILFGRALSGPVDGALLARLASLDPVFRAGSNGSVFQYQRFFPEDPDLRRLCELVAGAERLAADRSDLETGSPTTAVAIPVREYAAVQGPGRCAAGTTLAAPPRFT
jgi:hypothetical protein